MFKVGLDYPCLVLVEVCILTIWWIDSRILLKIVERLSNGQRMCYERGFLAFEYPVLNEFAAILAWFGVIGGTIYLLHQFYIFYIKHIELDDIYKIRRYVLFIS